jgi:hypothetical protein
MLQNELIAQLYKEDLFDELLTEKGNIPEKREQCRRDLDKLEQAAAILNEVKDFQSG